MCLIPFFRAQRLSYYIINVLDLPDKKLRQDIKHKDIKTHIVDFIDFLEWTIFYLSVNGIKCNTFLFHQTCFIR